MLLILTYQIPLTMESNSKNFPGYSFGIIFFTNLFFLIAFREVIIDKWTQPFLIVIVLLLALGGYVGLMILKWVHYRHVVILAGLGIIIGRLLLLFPETPILIDFSTIGGEYPRMVDFYPIFYAAMGLIFLCYGIFLTALLGNIGKWKYAESLSQEKMSAITRGIIPAYLLSFAFNLFFRLIVVIHCVIVQSILIVCAVAILTLWGATYPEDVSGVKNQNDWKKPAEAAAFPKKGKQLLRTGIFLLWALLRTAAIRPTTCRPSRARKSSISASRPPA